MKKELLLKVVKEKIIQKTKGKAGKVKISYSDFKDHFDLPLFHSESPDLPDLIDDLENETNGAIKLGDPLGNETNPENPLFSKHFYEVIYDPINVEYKNIELLKLSREKGLCRTIDQKEICYGISGERYRILDELKNNFILTEKLASSLTIPKENLMAQIGEIRKQISKVLTLDGSQVIESSKGHGYKIGKHFKITKS